jgi:hypothetical protein
VPPPVIAGGAPIGAGGGVLAALEVGTVDTSAENGASLALVPPSLLLCDDAVFPHADAASAAAANAVAIIVHASRRAVFEARLGAFAEIIVTG